MNFPVSADTTIHRRSNARPGARTFVGRTPRDSARALPSGGPGAWPRDPGPPPPAGCASSAITLDPELWARGPQAPRAGGHVAGGHAAGAARRPRTVGRCQRGAHSEGMGALDGIDVEGTDYSHLVCCGCRRGLPARSGAAALCTCAYVVEMDAQGCCGMREGVWRRQPPRAARRRLRRAPCAIALDLLHTCSEAATMPRNAFGGRIQLVAEVRWIEGGLGRLRRLDG
jgi:hypothetical protein